MSINYRVLRNVKVAVIVGVLAFAVLCPSATSRVLQRVLLWSAARVVAIVQPGVNAMVDQQLKTLHQSPASPPTHR